MRLVPAWGLARDASTQIADAAFAAGSALKTLDDLVRSAPCWISCWRARLALECAVSANRLLGQTVDAGALRDAILLCAPNDNPGPAGRVYQAYNTLLTSKQHLGSQYINTLGHLFGLRIDETASAIADLLEDLLQSGRAVPFVVAECLTKLYTLRPDAEVLAWWLADWLLAQKLGWLQPVPLLMATRFGTAFRTPTGRGRVRPDDAAFAGALCLALVQGCGEALQQAIVLDRKADHVMMIAPKLRTKGAETIIQKLLSQDALSASASGTNLSRWASRRLFERLESFGAVRELSGRPTFRIYGL